jgi:hypothetical protein
MPEAAVNKDSQALAAENEIGVAGDRLVATPAGDVGGAKNGGQLEFGGFVATRADCSHDLRALFLCEYVGHARILPQRRDQGQPQVTSEAKESADDEPQLSSCSRGGKADGPRHAARRDARRLDALKPG